MSDATALHIEKLSLFAARSDAAVLSTERKVL
jgi:hypothetical protein